MTNYITVGNYFNKNKLLTIFNQYKEEKYRPYRTKGAYVVERGYFEMYFSYEEGKDLFGGPPCRGYQFVHMPPNYEMVIHRDYSAIKCRIGSLIEGAGDILFYDDEDNIIDRYNYKEDILTNVQVRHNVINDNQWRLSFFANFEEELNVVKVSL